LPSFRRARRSKFEIGEPETVELGATGDGMEIQIAKQLHDHGERQLDKVVSPKMKGLFTIWENGDINDITNVGVRISVRLSFNMSERLIDATSILHYELEAPPVWRCVIAQLTVRE
jgi:hypothetical protein